MSDDKRLEEIAARAGAATEGSWWAWHPHPGGNCEYSLIKYHYDDVPSWLAQSSSHENSVANFEFIAHAREDVPYLLELVRESQAREKLFKRLANAAWQVHRDCYEHKVRVNDVHNCVLCTALDALMPFSALTPAAPPRGPAEAEEKP